MSVTLRTLLPSIAAPLLASAHDRQRQRDNGSGLTSNAILAWQQKRGVECRYNAPHQKFKQWSVPYFSPVFPIICWVSKQEATGKSGRRSMAGCCKLT
jgi:hypothetical protein